MGSMAKSHITMMKAPMTGVARTCQPSERRFTSPMRMPASTQDRYPTPR